MIKDAPALEIQIWPIERLVFYARNPRKNDAAVDRMCASIREFGFKIPVLARSSTWTISRLNVLKFREIWFVTISYNVADGRQREL
jgi:hypothetical protein